MRGVSSCWRLLHLKSIFCLSGFYPPDMSAVTQWIKSFFILNFFIFPACKLKEQKLKRIKSDMGGGGPKHLLRM